MQHYGTGHQRYYNRGVAKSRNTFDGLLNLNKPPGISSGKALDRVRGITGVRKSGHSGTLDPLASGVLVICMGRGTKLVEKLMDQPKRYTAVARLDVTSASHDAETAFEPVAVVSPPSRDEVLAALKEFEGDIEQVPPIFSALKIDGRCAYTLARNNKAVELKARRVRVYWLHLRRYEWPEVEFEMCCGRGTYVRSLVRDLGLRLGAGGCLKKLDRVAVGPYHIDGAVTLDELRKVPLELVAIGFEAALETLNQPPVIPQRPE